MFFIDGVFGAMMTVDISNDGNNNRKKKRKQCIYFVVLYRSCHFRVRF